MATHTSILAWKIPGIEEPGGLQSIGSQTWTQLRNRARMQTYGKSMFWSVPSECQASWPGSLCRGVLWSPAHWNHIQFSSQSCLTLCDPCSAAYQAALSVTKSLFKLMSIKSVMPSNHLILCHPHLLLPSIFPSIRVFSNESVLCIRWRSIGVSSSA